MGNTRDASVLGIRREGFSVEEAAIFLGISRQFAYACVKDGGIPSIRMGKKIIIARKTLEDMIPGGKLPE